MKNFTALNGKSTPILGGKISHQKSFLQHLASLRVWGGGFGVFIVDFD